MKFRLTIEVEVERESGKFATKDEVRDLIVEAITDANPDVIDGVGSDGESIYNVTDWSVEDA